MNNLKIIILSPVKIYKKICLIAKKEDLNLDCVNAHDIDSLKKSANYNYDCLLSFGTGVIVPSEILKKFKYFAINVHAGSINYPGRDPHHFAIYNNAKRYGATLHYMSESVDSGEILDMEMFDVIDEYKPEDLLKKSNVLGFKMIKRLFFNIKNDNNIKRVNDVKWGGVKSSRAMFNELCYITPNISKEELDRRFKSTIFKKYKNLYIDLHGYRFRLEKKIDE